MAAKKYYGVKKGKITGVFNSWEECKHSVEGYAGAEYKGFSTYHEAAAYLGNGEWAEQEVLKLADEKDAEASGNPDELLTYVDGSYDDAIKKYAFGCVFILPDGKIYTEYGNGDNPQSLQHRNVTGEMLGAMYAVKTAMFNGYKAIEIRYDYEGIEKWVTGEWRSKTELTGKYAASMREWGRSIKISFTKVPAHSHVKYNELADKLAKEGLIEGHGVPKIRKLEEMKPLVE